MPWSQMQQLLHQKLLKDIKFGLTYSYWIYAVLIIYFPLDLFSSFIYLINMYRTPTACQAA